MENQVENQTDTQAVPAVKSTSEKELLEELIKVQKSNGAKMTITMIAVIVMAVAVIVSSVIAVPKIVETFTELDLVLEEGEESITKMNTILDEVDTLVGENTEGVTDALEKVNSIDIESLNNSINELQTILQPIAKLLGTSKTK